MKDKEIKYKTINFKIEDEIYKELKLIVIKKDTTIKELVTNLIKNEIKENQK